MRKEETRKGWLLFALLALAVGVVSLPVFAGAATVADADNDGFSDTEEAAGITLTGGTLVPGCGASVPAPGQTRNACLDPKTKDLFVIFTPLATNSSMPAFNDAMEYVWRSKASGGLEIATHSITAAQVKTAPRNVTATQKAVKVGEASDATSTTVLGTSTYGTPNGTNNVIVYTKRIQAFIDGVCPAGVTCTDSTGLLDKAAVVAKYIRHTIAHEIGHDVSLTGTSNASYGGYHYATGTNTVMEQSVYKTTTSGVKFYVSDTFTSVDQGGYKMK